MNPNTSESVSEQYIRMTETPVSRLILKLGIPTTISMLATSIYNMADTYFVGSLGTSASGAVGIVFGLMAILQAVGFMFGHGAGSILSRSLGARDGERATNAASTGLFWSLAAGLLVTVFGLLFLNPLMRLLGSTETILPYAREYSMFILLAAPVMTGSFVLNNVLRYEGRALFSMVGLTTGGVLNIFGDWLLIRQLHMGIEGAGISTAVSQCISFCILLSPFLRGKTQSKLSLRAAKDSVRMVPEVCATGFPSLMRQGLTSISTMVLNGQAGVYGDAAVSAMTIVARICFFVFAVGLGIGQGFQPVSSFNYGAKKYSRVRRGFFFTLGVGECFLGLLAVVGMLLSSHLIGFFRDDPEVIVIGIFALRVQLVALFFQPLALCANMTFQSIGANKQATFIAVLRSGVYFIPLVLILPQFIGLTGVQIAQTVSDVLTFVTSVPFVIWFFRNLPQDGEPAIIGHK